MGLKGLMIAPVDSLKPGTSVMEACRLMDEKKVGALAVVEDRKLRGIFTHRDLVSRIVLAKRDPDPYLEGPFPAGRARSPNPGPQLGYGISGSSP